MRIEKTAWNAMVAHVQATYPNEGCGALLGAVTSGEKHVKVALPLENVFPGSQARGYELRPEDLLRVSREAREQGLELVGVFHSHPDCDACFSQADLRSACPWYSFVVLSIRNGELDHARCWRPGADLATAAEEELRVE